MPESPAQLPAVETALTRYHDTQVQLAQAAHELRLALPELQQKRMRENEARDDLQKRDEGRAAAHVEAEEASARFEALREAVGVKVEALQRQLSEARNAVETGEQRLKLANEALRKSGEARAVASEQAATADAALRQRSEVRGRTVSNLQKFAATGLFSAALPQAELPDMDVPWTIDPALALARRAEQLLSEFKDDDEAWSRVQRQIAEELTELQRALGALGHQAPAEPSDWGLIVYIIYQNRRERPDRLAARLAREIEQRGELLTANERAVLENHLQAEIASEIQRLLQAADMRVDAINKELHNRPTSAGVRYRLLWRPLTEEEGAPVGLEAARRRLLHTSADSGRPRTAESSAPCCNIASPPSASASIRAAGRTAPAACSTNSPARWTTAAGTASVSSVGRTGIGASSPARLPAANGRSASPCRCSPRWPVSTARAATPWRRG